MVFNMAPYIDSSSSNLMTRRLRCSNDPRKPDLIELITEESPLTQSSSVIGCQQLILSGGGAGENQPTLLSSIKQVNSRAGTVPENPQA
jgi:hypothetical protein